MFVVAGAALVLVWQTSQQAKPTSVVISTPDEMHVDHDHVVVAPAQTPAGSATGSAVTPAAAPPVTPPANHPPRARRSAYDQVIDARVPQLNACLHDHHESTVPASAKLHIDTSGRPTTVTLEPAALDATPLGACLKAVLQAARFPAAANETDLAFPFHAKST